MSPTALAILAGIFLGVAIIALAVVIIAHRTKRALTGRLTLLVVSLVAFLALSLMARSVDQDSYARCKDRAANTSKLNHFYKSMALIEATNTFVNTKIRNERVALYQGLILDPPHCGAKP